jgi:hypothetical protein
MEVVMDEPGFLSVAVTLANMHALYRLRQDRMVEQAWALNDAAAALEAANSERLSRLMRRRQQRGAMQRSSSSR